MELLRFDFQPKERDELVWILHLAAFLSGSAYCGFASLVVCPSLRMEYGRYPRYVLPLLMACFVVLTLASYFIFNEIVEIDAVDRYGEHQGDGVVHDWIHGPVCYMVSDWCTELFYMTLLNTCPQLWRTRKKKMLFFFKPPRRHR